MTKQSQEAPFFVHELNEVQIKSEGSVPLCFLPRVAIRVSMYRHTFKCVIAPATKISSKNIELKDTKPQIKLHMTSNTCSYRSIRTPFVIFSRLLSFQADISEISLTNHRQISRNTF